MRSNLLRWASFASICSQARWIPGIGASVVPEILKQARIDDVAVVEEARAVRACHELWQRHYSFVGGSSGTAFAVDSFSWNGPGWGSKAGFELAREVPIQRVFTDYRLLTPDYFFPIYFPVCTLLWRLSEDGKQALSCVRHMLDRRSG